MGLSESRESNPAEKSLCLIHVIRKTWRFVSGSSEKDFDDTDRETDFSSRCCSGCKECCYHQELTFDSESEMAPNAEEDLLVTFPHGPNSTKSGERLRPPTYNAEDYIHALKRWGRKPLLGINQDSHNTLPSTCTSSSSGYISGNCSGEMTLRQFTSVTELLNKLRLDLRLAFPSFVQEFASEGISLLLELLRTVQLAQSGTSSGPANPLRPRARRAAIDELGCLECLWISSERCPDTIRFLIQANSGLLALAVCLTSSLNRSRVIALQLLTRVCQTPDGHTTVSEAVSTLRLRFAEGGRFRFLAGALLASKAQLALRIAGLSFLNAFLKSAPKAQSKLYIQAEACEAGLEPRQVQEWLKSCDTESALGKQLRDEIRIWTNQCVDIEALESRANRAEETCRILSKKVTQLQKQLHKLQLERLNEYNSDRNQQFSDIEGFKDDPKRSKKHRVDPEKKISSSAEDEGISFSERSSSPEDQCSPSLENDQETTIDDVIEELRTIVKDAEEELQDWTDAQNSPQMENSEYRKSAAINPKNVRNLGHPSKAREYLHNSEESARVDRNINSMPPLKIIVADSRKQVLKKDELDGEAAIVPAIIHPQPPKKPPACIISALYQPHHPNIINDDRAVEIFDSHDEELLDDGSDSLLSASRLKSRAHDYDVSESVVEDRPRRKFRDNNHPINSLSSSRPYSKCSNTLQRRTEKKKYLRRCQSQEQMESPDSINGRAVLERIRKFESLNNFDERHSLPNLEETGLRRSESFHQTRNSLSSSNNGAGSDSGFNYLDNNINVNNKKLTKSLDKIEESFDSMVDIVLSKDKRHLYRRLSDDDNKIIKKKDKYHKNNNNNNKIYNNNHDNKNYTTFFGNENNNNINNNVNLKKNEKLFGGRPNEVLGFSKNRFNAGKYSGNHPQQFVKNLSRHINLPIQSTSTTSINKSNYRGKVTDIVSGLY